MYLLYNPVAGQVSLIHHKRPLFCLARPGKKSLPLNDSYHVVRPFLEISATWLLVRALYLQRSSLKFYDLCLFCPYYRKWQYYTLIASLLVLISPTCFLWVIVPEKRPLSIYFILLILFLLTRLNHLEIKPPNLSFQIVNILNGLPFADNEFDFVQMRLLALGKYFVYFILFYLLLIYLNVFFYATFVAII